MKVVPLVLAFMATAAMAAPVAAPVGMQIMIPVPSLNMLTITGLAEREAVPVPEPVAGVKRYVPPAPGKGRGGKREAAPEPEPVVPPAPGKGRGGKREAAAAPVVPPAPGKGRGGKRTAAPEPEPVVPPAPGKGRGGR